MLRDSARITWKEDAGETRQEISAMAGFCRRNGIECRRMNRREGPIPRRELVVLALEVQENRPRSSFDAGLLPSPPPQLLKGLGERWRRGFGVIGAACIRNRR